MLKILDSNGKQMWSCDREVKIIFSIESAALISPIDGAKCYM